MSRRLHGIATRVVDRYAAAGLTLGFAESLTGGLAAGTLCSVAGTSKIFVGSIVSYASAAKVGVLGVDPDLIDRYGAPSAEVAAEMARGARQVLECDIAVSMTGVAGPMPQDGWGVGHVHVASYDGVRMRIEHGVIHSKRRHQIRFASVERALNMALRALPAQ